YKEQLQVTIKVKDSAGKDLSNLVNQETTPLVIPVLKGDYVRVEAPVIDGYKVQGENFQVFNPIAQNETVTFTYKEQLQVTIKVKDSAGKDLSNLVNQETTPLVIPVLKGDNVRVEAPVIDGYKVQGDNFQEFNPITKDETVTFTYKEQLQVTIKVKDSAGKDLSNLVNQETT
ncbi:MucBP domain-containing protein, partial [Robinsoniella peoriensis]|uniref:MucBP domain-containing protein n=1 Tax=Robinsoniella peoriensis TaxID=180332 RepID=UPI001912FDA7